MSGILENFDENFPDWTDPELGIDGMVENVIKAEEKHKTAKENLFQEAIRISKETIAAGPDMLKEAPFYPGRDMFAFRGMPVDAILTDGQFDMFEADANEGSDIFFVRIYIDLEDGTENVRMFGVLVWEDETETERAWVGGEWTDEWDMYLDGPRACRTCEHKMDCIEFIGNRIQEQESERVGKVIGKLDEKFPKLKKFFEKNHIQMVVMPSPDSPSMAMLESLLVEEDNAY